MPGFPPPLINGINYSWANITLVLFGVPVVGITKINYSEKQDKANQYGAGPRPVSRSHGNITTEGSIEIYLDEWKRIIQASPNYRPLEIPPFDIIVTYDAVNVGQVPSVDVLRGVEFLNDPVSASQGDQRLLVTINLIIAQVDHIS